MRVAAVQTDPALGEPETNREAIRSAALAAEADLVVFPECALSGYAFQDREHALRCAETLPGPTTEELQAICRRSNRHVLFGLLERDGDRLFNAAALVGPGGLIGRYRKTHQLTLGVDRFADAGDLGLPVFDTGLCRLGILICFDLSFPETARVLKLSGAQVICVPTNWPAQARVSCDHAPPVRAQENHVHLVACNRTGREGGFEFRGSSRIVDFEGRVLAQADSGPDVIRAEIDPAAADRNRVVYRPGEYELDRIAARRPELYGPVAAPGSGG